MDSQDILLWGEVKPDWTLEERKRINSLCEWGKQYGIDGFVRCVSFLDAWRLLIGIFKGWK